MVRGRGLEVQAQKCKELNIPEFLEEYLPYYTLQTIAWPSLSIFRRLLAVYSAGQILENLRK